MSGGGGFYQYRCRYFASHNCPNWTWVRNSTCAYCLAEGRDLEEDAVTSAVWSWSREMRVPRVVDGDLHYTVMEIVPVDPSGIKSMLRQKATLPPTSIITPNYDKPGSLRGFDDRDVV